MPEIISEEKSELKSNSEANIDPELTEKIEEGLFGFNPGARSYEGSRETLKELLESSPQEARTILERKFLSALENGYVSIATAIKEELLGGEAVVAPETISLSAMDGLRKEIMLEPYRRVHIGSIQTLLDLVSPKDRAVAVDIIKQGVIDRLQKGVPDDALAIIDTFLSTDKEFLAQPDLARAVQTCFAKHPDGYGADKLIDRFQLDPEFIQAAAKRETVAILDYNKEYRPLAGMAYPIDSALRLVQKYDLPNEISEYQLPDELQALVSENNLQNLSQLVEKVKENNPARGGY